MKSYFNITETVCRDICILFILVWRDAGVQVTVSSCDVATELGTATLLEETRQELGPVGGVFHLAMVWQNNQSYISQFI